MVWYPSIHSFIHFISFISFHSFHFISFIWCLAPSYPSHLIHTPQSPTVQSNLLPYNLHNPCVHGQLLFITYFLFFYFIWCQSTINNCEIGIKFFTFFKQSENDSKQFITESDHSFSMRHTFVSFFLIVFSKIFIIPFNTVCHQVETSSKRFRASFAYFTSKMHSS